MMVLGVAAGGALGALARFWLTGAVDRLAGGAFPLGTLTVNVLGSLALGYFVALFAAHSSGTDWRPFVAIGLLGAFTTFSAFSVETLQLFYQGAYLRSVGYVFASVTLCIAAAALGMWAGRIE